MSALSQISDFFGSYPEIDLGVPMSESVFNTLISRKEEFRELTPQISEPPPARGEAFPHQKFSVRYMTWFDRDLFIHDPGTGKSCIITHSAELFKNDYLKNPNDATKIRRAYILVQGPTLEDNIRDQIVCRCTDRVYETTHVMQSIDEKEMRARLKREVAQWYEILTYGDFAKKIREFRREQDLEDFMSNIATYVDEAHNVPKEAGKRSTRASPTAIDQYTDEILYETIHRAFHKGKRNKVFLFTATPMINSPIDIIALINLILPLNFQMEHVSVENEVEFANRPLEFFEPYFRGRVSYIRALETGALEMAMGDPVTEVDLNTGQPIQYDTRVQPCYMSRHQYATYLSARETEPAGFYDHQRQASNFVFPDGSFGGGENPVLKGFDKYVEFVQGRYQFRQTQDGLYLQQILRNPDVENGLALLSAKYAEILYVCQESYPQAEVVMDDALGIIFVYFADFVHGSGAIMLGLSLREQGYEEFRETRNIFVEGRNASTMRRPGPCAVQTESDVVRESRIPRRKRFALLTGETPKALRDTIFNTLNSYENRYGQYLQVLIGSRTSREGININNGIAMMMASGSWNYSSNYQAKERVFRATSHVLRINEKRARLLQQGLPADNVTFPVRTYNLAAVYDGEPNSEYEILRESNSDTIDPKMYTLAEQKDRLIRRITRHIKQSCYDCWINYNRNVRPTDVDGSAVCDYMQCAYQCAGIREEFLTPLDRTTKILYYSSEEVANAESAITNLFSRFNSLRIEQIHQRIIETDPTIDPIFINMAIQRLIQNNTTILDRMGFFGYLRESPRGTIYLE